MTKWGEKPYHSLDYMLRERFGEKVYKVTLNGGMSCPNRDGKIGTRGCIFCSAGGSGDFAADAALSITDQIESQISILSQKRPIHKYIAYFQAYTNTYAPVEYLEKIFTEAISHPKIVALSIGTRPDCLSPEIVTLLSRLNKQKPVWIELGLQTIHESTARYIRRGYPLCVFDDAVKRLRKENIEVIVHTILGLPGENTADILETMEYLNHMDIQGIKLQLLHVLRGTDLAADYEKGLFQTYERDEYISLLINCLEHLRPDMVIHRITGDGPKDLLIAPLWASRKREVLNMLHHRMKEEQSYQGRLFSHSKILCYSMQRRDKMATPFTVYKLIVLYMLQNTENTLTNSQISEFILDREYTNYFHLQQAISELVEAELITMDTRSNVSHYRITEDGIKTLSFFQKDLSPEIKQEVREYLKSTGFKAQERIVTPADYYITKQGTYSVRCQLIEKGNSLIDLNIAAPNLEAAQSICKKWSTHYQEIYGKIMEELL